MTEQIVTWVLGIVATLFGGLNIFQWITLRSYKRLRSAEADAKEIENLKSAMETIQASMNAQILLLERRVKDAEQRAQDNADKYTALSKKYDTLEKEFENYKQNHK